MYWLSNLLVRNSMNGVFTFGFSNPSLMSTRKWLKNILLDEKGWFCMHSLTFWVWVRGFRICNICYIAIAIVISFHSCNYDYSWKCGIWLVRFCTKECGDVQVVNEHFVIIALLQVVELPGPGPVKPLRMFLKVPHLRILAAGVSLWHRRCGPCVRCMVPPASRIPPR